MKVRYTRRAEGDLEAINAWLTERSPSGARAVLGAIHAAIAIVADSPLAGPEADIPTVRTKLVLNRSYRIFYRIDEDAVEVLHVRHTSRKLWRGGDS